MLSFLPKETSGLNWAQILKPSCVSALKRIFKLCDANKDGILDASELNEFQVRGFFKIYHFYLDTTLAEMFRRTFTTPRTGRHKGDGPPTR